MYASTQIPHIKIQAVGFDGQLTDKQTHWQYLGKGYRAYNQMLHRFMSEDTLSPFEKGGVNGYIFSHNNPIMRYDPTGHFSVTDLIPHTWTAWGGFGAAVASASAIGAVVGVLATAPFSLAAGVALAGGVGGVSNAVGEYVGQGLASHQWVPDWQFGGKIATAFSTGVVLGIATAGISMLFAKGAKFARARYVEQQEQRIASVANAGGRRFTQFASGRENFLENWLQEHEGVSYEQGRRATFMSGTENERLAHSFDRAASNYDLYIRDGSLPDGEQTVENTFQNGQRRYSRMNRTNWSGPRRSTRLATGLRFNEEANQVRRISRIDNDNFSDSLPEGYTSE